MWTWVGSCKCRRRSDVCVKVINFWDVSLTSPYLGRGVGRILHTPALKAGRTQHSFSNLHLHSLGSLQALSIYWQCSTDTKYTFYLWTDANFVVPSFVCNVNVAVCKTFCVNANSERQQRTPLLTFMSTVYFYSNERNIDWRHWRRDWRKLRDEELHCLCSSSYTRMKIEVLLQMTPGCCMSRLDCLEGF